MLDKNKIFKDIVTAWTENKRTNEGTLATWVSYVEDGKIYFTYNGFTAFKVDVAMFPFDIDKLSGRRENGNAIKRFFSEEVEYVNAKVDFIKPKEVGVKKTLAKIVSVEHDCDSFVWVDSAFLKYFKGGNIRIRKVDAYKNAVLVTDSYDNEAMIIMPVRVNQ